MAASVAMILEAATGKRDGASESGTEPLTDGGGTGAAMNVTSATSAPPRGITDAADAKRFTPPVVDAEAVAIGSAPSVSETETTTAPAPAPALVINTSLIVPATPVTQPPTQAKKVTPTNSRANSAKNALGIPTSKKKTKKKTTRPSHPSVGISVDALDSNKAWGNGRIIDVNVEEQRLQIMFPGFSKKWEIWTDMLSIAPHGRFATHSRRVARSWDGRTNLFTGERIVTEDCDEADGSEDLEHVKTTPRGVVDTVPSKLPGRKPKKGYVLEVVAEEDGVVASSALPKPSGKNKHRPTSATLKRQAATARDDAEETTPKKVRAVKHKVPLVVRDPYTDAELTKQREQNASTLDKSAAFLSQCAALWKRQLGAMSEGEQKALFAGQHDDGGVAVERESTVV